MQLEIKMDMKRLKKRLRERADAAQRVLTVECKKAADKFTPMDTGNLKNNFDYTENEHGVEDGWRYREPYAWRQWKGLTKDGKYFDYSLIANSDARSRWSEHGLALDKENIIAAVREELEK